MNAAADQVELPAGGDILFPLGGEDGTMDMTLWGLGPECSRVESGGMFERVRRISVDRQGENPWAFRLRAAIESPIKAGDVVHVRFWARCAFSDTGSARMAVVVEEAAEPHAKMLDLPVTVGTDWRCVDMPLTVTADYAAGAWQLSIRLGYMPQLVQLAALTVRSYGRTLKPHDLPHWKSSYSGREANAEWRDHAAERIDRLRKGDLQIIVVGNDGQPVNGAKIRAKLIQPAFGFGTCVSLKCLEENENAQCYRQTLLQLFNQAVIENALKWPAIDADGDDNADRLVCWLNKHNMPTRGHCLIWPSEQRMPASVVAMADDPHRFRRTIERHIQRMVERYRGRLIDWDVVNEPYAHHFAMDVLGGNQVMADWFKIAHAADPACKLYINDYEILASGDMLGTPHQEHFYRTTADLLEAGAPLHGVGMQGHFGGNITSPDNLLKILDRFASLGVRIKITELDVQLADESLRADYYRDLLTILFSHPAVDAVMQWGFWEGSHWIPSSAILDRSWKLRPHGEVFTELAHRQWRSDEMAITNQEGCVKVRAFRGHYQVRMLDGDQVVATTEIELTDQANCTLRLA